MILVSLVALIMGGVTVFTSGSELIAALRMEDQVKSSYVMFALIFFSPFMLYVFLLLIYLGITYKPAELEKVRKKKKKKQSPTLYERIMIFVLAIAFLGLVVSIPLSWYMHFRLLDAGYVVCENKYGKGATRYAKEKERCH